MQEHITFIEWAVATLRTKGWTDTYAKMETKYINGWVFKDAYIQPNLDDIEKGDLFPTGIYISDFTDLAHGERKWKEISDFPTVKEYRTSKLLAAISSLQEQAETLGLSPDFINPITALADQLRTNIIEHKPANEIPF